MTTITRKHLATLSPDEAAALWLVERDKEALVEAGLFEEWLADRRRGTIELRRAADGQKHRVRSLHAKVLLGEQSIA